MFSKKGVDAVVATVLIVMITVAAVAIIWAFVIPMIKESAVSSTKETVKLSIETSGGYTTWDEVNKIARVQVKRGNDNSNLTGLDFSFVSKGISINKNKTDVPQPNQIKVYEFDLSGELNTRPEKVLIAPITASGVGSVVSESGAMQNYSGLNPPCDYSDWSVCNSSGFRNKTKLSSSLLGCVGNSVVIEGCTPTCTSWTYSSWSTCNSSGLQNRSILTSSPSGCSGGTPVLIQSCTYVPSCVSYSVQNGAFVLCTCQDLQNMSANLAANYTLGQDIDCTATRTWNCVSGVCEGFIPVGNSSPFFNGTFNGQKHSVSNLFINRLATDYVGLFGVVWNNGNIQSVNLVNGNISGRTVVGGLVGHQQPSSILSQVSSSGIVKGNSKVGGLVGYSSGTIIQSYSSANVAANVDYAGGLVSYLLGGSISNSYAVGNVTALILVGGFVGQISNSGSISNSYSAGKVTSIQSPVGGFAALSTVATSSSYWDHETSGQPNSAGGVIPKTTILMKQQATFNGWDFVNIWNINEGNSYPTLK